MISRCRFITFGSGISVEKAGREWLDRTRTLDAEMCGNCQPELSLVIDKEQRSPFQRGQMDCDGYAEFHFADLFEMSRGFPAISVAQQGWVSGPGLSFRDLIFVKKIDKPVPESLLGGPLVKRISFLRRRPEVSARRFQSEWWGLHSDLVRRMPGYVGYNQNLVIGREIEGRPVSHDMLPVDGMVEFWFEDLDGFDACYASEEFRKTACHGAEFIGEITTFIVETRAAKLSP